MWSLLLNLFIALIWLFLSSEPGLTAFLVGYALGLVLVATFRRLLPADRYLPRVAGAARFAVVFTREFVIANLQMLRVVLFRSRDDLYPKFITLDLDDLKPWEALLLSHCITLTPGTTSVRMAEDYSSLIIHALDAARPDEVRDRINQTLKAAILRFSR